jgi:hypothetical protein
MSSENGRARTSIVELARRLRSEMTPVSSRFSWFAIQPIAEEDLKQYLQEPVAALPPAVVELLPPMGIVLTPYLERGTGRNGIAVVYEKPQESRLVLSSSVLSDDFATLFFTVRDEQVADYHYFLYDEIAGILGQQLPEEIRDAWHGLLREELSAEVHGEIDERSWRAKQALLRRPAAGRRDGKPFRDYARESFRDTATLFLHGICCDIDVQTGPRQIPGRWLRKRLEKLKTLFPPPEGHAVFPEDIRQT